LEADTRSAIRLTLIVEYDGTNFYGFQYQTGLPTVQRQLEEAIGKLTGEEARVRGASRTDSGVHAAGQVVDFLTTARFPEETWTKALNFHLPWDIKVKATYNVPTDFNSRRRATTRTYRYTILNRKTPSPLLHNRCAWIREPLDTEKMHRGAQALVGLHDFSAFAGTLPPEKSGVREAKSWSVWREGELVLVEARANAFLPHQILRTNGLLVQIGTGKARESAVQETLEGSIINGNRAASLPPQGLCLMKVEYPDFPPRENQ